MDQTFSLSSQSAPVSTASGQASAAVNSSVAAIADEEPESPDRSSRQDPSAPASPDPLAEGLAVLTGVVLALMAVLVPLAAVVSDSGRPEPSETVRAGW